MSRRRLDPDTLTRPLTIKISEALLAQVTISAQRADQSRGEWIREAIGLAIARGSTR